jgi:hypothetical protein
MMDETDVKKFEAYCKAREFESLCKATFTPRLLFSKGSSFREDHHYDMSNDKDGVPSLDLLIKTRYQFNIDFDDLLPDNSEGNKISTFEIIYYPDGDGISMFTYYRQKNGSTPDCGYDVFSMNDLGLEDTLTVILKKMEERLAQKPPEKKRPPKRIVDSTHVYHYTRSDELTFSFKVVQDLDAGLILMFDLNRMDGRSRFNGVTVEDFDSCYERADTQESLALDVLEAHFRISEVEDYYKALAALQDK